ncbi:MAG TPA: hypothetical protein VN605_11375, partial [Thermoanaerobaculia bacterium]|nr:hypothetical protein [Thermoanaerobaculia bacterium]
MVSALGIVVIAGSFVGRRVSFNHLLDEWRKAEPRVWAGVMRPSRRAFPFSVFARSMATENYAKMWSSSTPEWAAGSP